MPEPDRRPEAASDATEEPPDVDQEPDEPAEPSGPEPGQPGEEVRLPRPRRPGWFSV